MLDKPDGVKRRADLVSLNDTASDSPLVSRYVRGQNFLIEWLDAKANAPALLLSSDDETILLTLDAGAKIVGSVGETSIADRTVVVLPAGDFQIYLETGRAAVLSTSRKGISASALNAGSYAKRDERVSPLEKAWERRNGSKELQIFEIDKVKAPADNPRLKMFQSSTMSHQLGRLRWAARSQILKSALSRGFRAGIPGCCGKLRSSSTGDLGQ